MNVFVIIASVIFLSGIFVQNISDTGISQKKNPKSKVSSNAVTVTPSAAPSVVTPTREINIIPSNTPIPETKSTFYLKTDETYWYTYPQSTLTMQNENEFIYETQDMPGIVTSWYEKVISDRGFQVKSFIKTTTNGVVENSLTAATKNNKISVVISREQSAPQTMIKITK